MTDEQRFLFDLQGYLVVPEVHDRETVARMLAEMDARGVDPPAENTDSYRFSGFFRWSDDFRNLIDQARILPILAEILGPRFRLDHAYGMATSPSPTGMPFVADSLAPAGSPLDRVGLVHRLRRDDSSRQVQGPRRHRAGCV